MRQNGTGLFIIHGRIELVNVICFAHSVNAPTTTARSPRDRSLTQPGRGMTIVVLDMDVCAMLEQSSRGPDDAVL
jgi:hypothetical protein